MLVSNNTYSRDVIHNAYCRDVLRIEKIEAAIVQQFYMESVQNFKNS